MNIKIEQFVAAICCFLLLNTGCFQNDPPKPEVAEAYEIAPLQEPRQTESVDLLGNGLAEWTITNFGGEGEIEIAEGTVQLEMGYPMTGITWNGTELPSENYEISLEAMKTDGNDFFCGLTFPVGDGHCTLVLGGWGGSLVGLSCIDGDDASNNGTKLYRNFEADRWYRIVVYVDANGIEVKIDDEVVIDQARGEHKFSVRGETLPCRPLGICNYQTSSAVRNIVLTDHN